jgi:hypothetical protein
MPNQTVGNVHISAPLSQLARLYRPTDFIADLVCPPIGVVKENDLYYVFDQGPWFATDVDDLVPDKSKPRKVEISHSTENYTCQRRELAWDVSDRERKNADDQLRLETNRQRNVLGRLLLKREIRVANALRKTTNGGGLNLGAAAGAKWDAVTTKYENFASDVMTGKTAIRQKIGINPNVLVIPAAVAEGMHKSLLYQAIQYTYGSETARNLIEQEYPVLPPVMFGMRVIVPGEIKNTAKEGQTPSYSDIWGEAVRMLYVTQGPDTEEPSVAYTFQSEPMTTRTWRDEEARMDSFATGFTIDDAKVVGPDAGYEIDDCLT